MNVPADALTSGRPNTEPSRTFSADSRCSHLSAAPDHSATDIAIPPLERSPNQTAYRSATVVLDEGMRIGQILHRVKRVRRAMLVDAKLDVVDRAPIIIRP